MSSVFVEEKKGGGPLTATKIQRLLDENAALIQTIVEQQSAGRAGEALAYQQSLHRNLLFLASLADSVPPAAADDPNGEKLCQALADAAPRPPQDSPATAATPPATLPPSSLPNGLPHPPPASQAPPPASQPQGPPSSHASQAHASQAPPQGAPQVQMMRAPAPQHFQPGGAYAQPAAVENGYAQHFPQRYAAPGPPHSLHQPSPQHYQHYQQHPGQPQPHPAQGHPQQPPRSQP